MLDLVLTREPDLVSEVKTGDKFNSSNYNMITFKIHLSSPSAIKKLAMRNYQREVIMTVLEVIYYLQLIGKLICPDLQRNAG